MDNNSPVVQIVLALLLLGFVNILVRQRAIATRAGFVRSYLNKFSGVAQSSTQGRFDGEQYTWLMLNSSKMDAEMGQHGIMASYIPPFARYAVTNYPLLVNTLAEIRTGKAHEHMLGALHDAILRRLGEIDTELSQNAKLLLNPLVWLREGIHWLVVLPFRMVYWSGLMQYGSFRRASNNVVLNLITFVIEVISLAASVLQLTQGWDDVQEFVCQWFPSFMR